MARKRMIDPSIWSDDGMAQLSPRQQLLYIGLISNADDAGRLKGSAVAIRLMCPTVYYDEHDDEAIENDLGTILDVMGKLRRYVVDGKPYLEFKNYRTWQRIDKPQPSKLPEPSAGADSENVLGMVGEPSASDSGTVLPNRIEENRSKEKRSNAAAPAPAETPAALVDTYCQARGQPFPDDAGPFVNIAKSLQKRRYTSADVDGCTRYLLTDPYWEPILTFKILASQLPDWVQNGRPEKVTANKRNGKATEPDFSGIEGFSETMSALEQRR